MRTAHPGISGPLIKGTPTVPKQSRTVFSKQPMGHNYLASIGKDIAKRLNLPNPDSYTGHCFRRTSATLAADAGADVEQIKRLGKWSSSSVASRYVANSVAGAEAIAETLTPTSISKSVNNVVISQEAEGGCTIKVQGNYINLTGSNNTLNFN